MISAYSTELFQKKAPIKNWTAYIFNQYERLLKHLRHFRVDEAKVRETEAWLVEPFLNDCSTKPSLMYIYMHLRHAKILSKALYAIKNNVYKCEECEISENMRLLCRALNGLNSELAKVDGQLEYSGGVVHHPSFFIDALIFFIRQIDHKKITKSSNRGLYYAILRFFDCVYNIWDVSPIFMSAKSLIKTIKKDGLFKNKHQLKEIVRCLMEDKGLVSKFHMCPKGKWEELLFSKCKFKEVLFATF